MTKITKFYVRYKTFSMKTKDTRNTTLQILIWIERRSTLSFPTDS